MAEVPMFDLAEVDTKTRADAGVIYTVKKMDGEPLLSRNEKPVTLTLHGPDSDRYREKQNDFIRRRLERAAASNGERPPIDLAAAEVEIIETLAACTSGWAEVLDTKGEPIPFSHDTVAALYRNYPVIREQVEAFITDRAHFINAPSKA